MKQVDKIRFDKVGFLDGDGNEVSGWLALIDTQEKLEDYLALQSYENAQIWFDIKSSPEDKDGHCPTTKASVYKTLLMIKAEKEGKKQINLVDGIKHIAYLSMDTKVKIFLKDGEVYVGQNGSCRDTHLRDDGRLDEFVFDTCYNEDFIFPSISKNDVKIKKWQGGNHFYITINGITTNLKGKEKWNTIEAVEKAKKILLKQNRFKDSKLKNGLII